MPIRISPVFFLTFIFLLNACGDETQGSGDNPSTDKTTLSFVEACNLHCSYAHQAPEGCPSDLSESLNSCLHDCAMEDAMAFDALCEAAGVTYYQCTWELTFVCTEGQEQPIPSNLADCAEQSGEWNACLLGG